MMNILTLMYDTVVLFYAIQFAFSQIFGSCKLCIYIRNISELYQGNPISESPVGSVITLSEFTWGCTLMGQISK